MKKICIICEGSYPYVTGGVSGWVDQLIRMNTEYEFYVVALIPNREFAKLKYKIPDNVLKIKNIVLNNYEVLEGYVDFKTRFDEDFDIKSRVKKIFDFKKLKEEELLETIDYFSQFTKEEHVEIVLNSSFWEGIADYYYEKGFEKSLNKYYWTYRNLFLNLISLGIENIPKADLYHSISTGYAGVLTSLINYRGEGKTLITEHGIYSREREEDIISSTWIDNKFKEEWIGFFNSMCSAAYKYSDMIVTLFEYNREYQISHGADRKKTFVVPNGINVEAYSKIKKYKKDVFSIGSVSRIVPIKDVKMMIKGFKIALLTIKKAHLYLIGPTDEDEEYYKECLELVEELELQDYVTFTGRVNVKEYYEFLDVFLLTSVSEGQPLSILEAMASGIACIATDVGNCKDMLLGKKEIGDGGIVIPPTSYAALAEAIIDLYKNDDKRERMSENNLKIVKKYYKKEDFEKAYKYIYKSLIQGE